MQTELIDPAVLALKSDAELRDFLSVLRQKECDERVNVNFAPYRSQRAIAETRLNNVQNKIRQVEAEFDRRRCAMLPAPTLSTRVVQQFSRPCYSARFEDPRRLYSTVPPDVPPSPDPFVCVKPRSPKRLLLKPRTGNPAETPAQAAPPASVPPNPPKPTVDDGGRAKETSATARSPERQYSSTDNCACCCDRTTSEESIDEAKKKLRPRIAKIDGQMMMNNVGGPGYEASSVMRLAKRWMATVCLNVTLDVESTRTSAESENGTIALCGRIDGDVSESRGAIEIRGAAVDRALNQEKCTSWPNARQQSEKEEIKESISKRDESTEMRDSEIGDSRGAPLAEVGQEEATIKTGAKVTEDDSRIWSAQEARERPVDGVYTSSLRITLKSRKGEPCESEQKERNDETLPLISSETMERSANEGKAISRSKRRTRFQIISLMTDIVYDKKHEYKEEREIGNKTVNSGGRISVAVGVGKFDKQSSIKNLGESANARDIAEKNRPEGMLSERLDPPKLCSVDHPCETIPKLAGEYGETSTAVLSKTNAFPLFKYPRECATGKSLV